MERFNNLLKEHLSKWALVWFGFLFWGSIFSAILMTLFQNTSHLYLYVLGYFLGLIFGIISKINKWSWIN